MSTFDDVFDADRKLSRSGCGCGRHRSVDEHNQAVLTLRCEAPPNDEARRAFAAMIDTREQAYAARLPQADALLATAR